MIGWRVEFRGREQKKVGGEKEIRDQLFERKTETEEMLEAKKPNTGTADEGVGEAGFTRLTLYTSLYRIFC